MCVSTKTALDLLNKLFHDEQRDCMNLKTSLEMLAEEAALSPETLISAAVVTAALEARGKINSKTLNEYYKLREYLEQLDTFVEANIQ